MKGVHAYVEANGGHFEHLLRLSELIFSYLLLSRRVTDMTFCTSEMKEFSDIIIVWNFFGVCKGIFENPIN